MRLVVAAFSVLTVITAVALTGCGTSRTADGLYSADQVSKVFAQAGEPLRAFELSPLMRRRGMIGYFQGAGQDRAGLIVFVYGKRVPHPINACTGEGCSRIVGVRNVVVSYSGVFAQGSAADVRRVRNALQTLRHGS